MSQFKHNLNKFQFIPNMARTENISLRDSRPEPGESNLTILDTEQDEQFNSRELHGESNRKRACVLVGSAILQLPIWGAPG